MKQYPDGKGGLKDHFKNGGGLLSIEEVIDPYREELLQTLAAFFDCELAVSAGFTCLLDMVPNIQMRVNVARLIAEKAEHARVLLDMMGELGNERPEYLNRLHGAEGFDWAARLKRDSDLSLGASISLDKRLPVLYYPIENWLDAVIMYVLMEKAAYILISELGQIFYKPLTMACQLVMTSERQYTNLSSEELLRLAKGAYKNGNFEKIEASFNYWLQRTRANFDPDNLPYFERLRALGLPHRSNQEMLNEFDLKVDDLRLSLNLVMRL